MPHYVEGIPNFLHVKPYPPSVTHPGNILPYRLAKMTQVTCILTIRSLHHLRSLDSNDSDTACYRTHRIIYRDTMIINANLLDKFSMMA